jgi:hypothetical protein
MDPAARDAARDSMAPDAARAALEARYAERLLDDEALRADLTDEEFAPAQAWALERLHARVTDLPALDAAAEAALEELTTALRAVLRALNDLVGQRFDRDAAAFAAEVRALGDVLAPALYDQPSTVAAARARLMQLADALAARKDTDDGAALVSELLAALDPARAEPQETA